MTMFAPYQDQFDQIGQEFDQNLQESASRIGGQQPIDSQQAGRRGGGGMFQDWQGASLQNMTPQAAYSGSPAPIQEPSAQMPEAYQKNRMKEYGMPKIMQVGESLYDDYRAGKWNEENGMGQLEGALGASDPNAKPGSPAGKPAPIKMDEIQIAKHGGDPQQAFDARQAQGNAGNRASDWGILAGKVGEMVANYYTGGMYSQGKDMFQSEEADALSQNESNLAGLFGSMGGGGM